MLSTQGPKDMPEPGELSRNDGFRYRAECKLAGQIYRRLELGGN